MKGVNYVYKHNKITNVKNVKNSIINNKITNA